VLTGRKVVHWLSILGGAARVTAVSPNQQEDAMKYMLQVIGFADEEFAEGEGPTAEEFIGWQQALLDAGAHVDGGFLDDYRLATSVQVTQQAERVITNGPFPETREFLGGWTVIDVADLDAALAWAERCPGAKYGRIEVRPVMGS
jgi:hypothetical protein